MAKRRLPIRTQHIEMTEEWEGWSFTARVNPTLRTVGDVSSGDFDRMIPGLAGIIQQWNFVDEEGEPMAPPDQETIGNLPTDLIIAVSKTIVEKVTNLEGN